MLCRVKFGFTLLPCLVIDLKSVIKKLEIHEKSCNTTKSRVPFLTVYCTIVLIAGPIFSTAFWTLAYYVPLLRHVIYRELLHEIEIYLPKVMQ